ncbi:MAG: DUF2914 domain-containing protein [Elusimicrobia bacterium]|nr:DUF2914 domain-containing protein [Elusimicrobiota bacterium]
MTEIGKALAAVLVLSSAAVWAAEELPPVEITQGHLCTSIVDKQAADPKASGYEYAAGTDRVYFWNFANVAHPPATVKHVWWRDGKKLSEIRLELKHARNRTWTFKKVYRGAWKVETVSPEGIVLAVAEFKVK